MRIKCLLLSLILPVFIYANSSSSRCLSLPPVSEAYEEAAAVFLGEVIEVDDFHFKFKVERIWKGKRLREITLVTGAVENKEYGVIYNRDLSWRYNFVLGKKYLVYADKIPKGLYGHKCSRINPIEKAAKDIEELDIIIAGKK